MPCYHLLASLAIGYTVGCAVSSRVGSLLLAKNALLVMLAYGYVSMYIHNVQ